MKYVFSTSVLRRDVLHYGVVRTQSSLCRLSCLSLHILLQTLHIFHYASLLRFDIILILLFASHTRQALHGVDFLRIFLREFLPLNQRAYQFPFLLLYIDATDIYSSCNYIQILMLFIDHVTIYINTIAVFCYFFV